MTIEGDFHSDRVFKEPDLAGGLLDGVQFTDCIFRHGSFVETRFRACRFQSCTFEHCDLGLADVTDSLFAEVRVLDSKVMGVNWTAARWPDVSLGDPLVFERCVLSHSTFLGLALGGIAIRECVAREVDFREADLNGADFSGTDLAGSLFSSTDLRKADFTTAKNYRIPPEENRIEKAKFSLPEALSLLYVLGIELED